MSNTPRRKPARAGTRTAPPRTMTTTSASGPQGQWSRRLGFLGATALVAAILALVVLGGGDDDLPDGAPDGVEFVAVDQPQHVDGEIAYDATVPAGGPHNPIWQNCGFYDGEVRPENAVHALEHGAVWITYRRDIGEDAIGSLRGLTRNRSQVIVSEVPALETPVHATAWGVELALHSYDDVALKQFIREFTDGPFAPEPGANCNGGVGNPA
ncbi:MAG: DUF3105 domain-containing protein [Acidimicrobiia bacterium]